MIADAYTIFDTTESLIKHKGKKYLYVYGHVNKHSFAEFEPTIIKEGKTLELSFFLNSQTNNKFSDFFFLLKIL